MMDFEHKEKQDVLNKSVVMDKQTLDKFLLENSVEDLLKENDQKVVDNNVQQVNQEEVGNIIVNEAPLVQANVDAGNNANIFIRKPVPHLSRSLAKSMRKILKWEGKKSADAAVPVHEAINSVLHAHSESEFVDAMEELAERAVNYIRLRPGKRFGFRNGNQRKADINDLLNQIAVFSANSYSSLIRKIEVKANGYSDRQEG